MPESHSQPTPNPPSIDSSLSRRSTRPTSIRTSRPEQTAGLGEIQERPPTTPVIVYSDSDPPPQTSPRPVRGDHRQMESPCFVHSHLDKGASLTEWLYNKQPLLSRDTDVGVSKSLQRTNRVSPYHQGSITRPSSSTIENNVDDEDGFAESLTKQLAETAVGVREMSKQLGQCSRLSPTA